MSKGPREIFSRLRLGKVTKITSKTLLAITIILVALFVVPTTFAAVDLTITCDTASCSSSPSGGPVFNESNMFPLGTVARAVKAENISGDNLDFAIEVRGSTFSDSTPPLSDVLTVTITEIESGTVVYGPKSITDWKADGLVTLSTVPSGGERNYGFVVELTDVGNEYQGKSLSFDLNLGFETLPGSVLAEETKFPGKVLGVKVLPATGQFRLGLALLMISCLGLGFLLRRYSAEDR